MPIPLTEEAKKEQERKLAEVSYVLPWMEEVVASSLPYLAKPAKIRQTLEECKGNIDEAVSRLLDADEEGPEETSEAKDASGPPPPPSSPPPPPPPPPATEKGAEAGTEDIGKPTARQLRASTRLKAKEEGKLKRTGSGGGPKDPCPKTEKTRKQPAQRPKRETDREKKEKKKEAAKARKREKSVGKKDEGPEKGAATITSGIKELYI